MTGLLERCWTTFEDEVSETRSEPSKNSTNESQTVIQNMPRCTKSQVSDSVKNHSNAPDRRSA